MTTYEKIMKVIEWVYDLQTNDPILDTGGAWSRDYLGIFNASPEELDTICEAVNSLLTVISAPLRVCWVAGEIRPVWEQSRIEIIDSMK